MAMPMRSDRSGTSMCAGLGRFSVVARCFGISGENRGEQSGFFLVEFQFKRGALPRIGQSIPDFHHHLAGMDIDHDEIIRRTGTTATSASSAIHFRHGPMPLCAFKVVSRVPAGSCVPM